MTGHVPRIKARLSLLAHRKVLGLLEGEYAAAQLGRGMEFNDLREYVRGDDVKDLDWKASARTGEMLVKRYVAQRRNTVLLVVSTGRGLAAAHALEPGGPGGMRAKRDVAVEVAGLVGWLAARQGDLVGVCWGDAETQGGLPPRSGELHLERCLAAAYDAVRPAGGASDLTAVLRSVARTVRRRTLMVVVADEEEPTPELLSTLRRADAQHEVLLVTVGDLDPVAVGSRAPGARDVADGRGLPAWLRGDARLAAELDAARAAARARFHTAVAGLGIVHEHVASGTDTLSAVRRLLVRHQHAHRR